MKRVSLGRTGLAIHPLVFGSLPLGPLQANLSVAAGARIIRTALESGVNLIDTAALYQTYPYLRTALEGFAGTVHLASKTHASDGMTARQHVEAALRALGREQLDIVHLHGARLVDPFVERAEVFDTLRQMQQEGKIAHLGLSTHYIVGVEKAAAEPDIAVIHPLINRNGMGILDGSARQMATAIAAAAAAGKGVYAMKALAGGNLISDARASLDYVRQLPGVQALAVGMLSEDEVLANIALFEEDPVDDQVWTQLQSRQRRLQIMEQFCKGCGQCLTACTNQALALKNGVAQVEEEKCILCGYCAVACPEFLIRVV
jgi:aryl-alcohol dehydrogenase-like predicted oxidoreductase